MMILRLILFFVTLLLTSCNHEQNNPLDPEYQKNSGVVVDIDGNVYHTITIGKQIWMVENLRTTKYKNGYPIQNVTDNSQWANLVTGAFCWYSNEMSYKSEYGALYNWYAVNNYISIAPNGWHIPTIAEIDTLMNFLGGSNIAGSKLKEYGTIHWKSPNADATNETGFTAFPGGYRGTDGSFYGIGAIGCWYYLSGDFIGVPVYNNFVLESQHAHVGFSGNDNRYYAVGYSIRCLKD